jgi:hypothetical protein
MSRFSAWGELLARSAGFSAASLLVPQIVENVSAL